MENILDPILAPDLNFRPWKIALSVWEIKQSPKFKACLTVEMIANLEPGNQLANVVPCSLGQFPIYSLALNTSSYDVAS